MPKYSSFRYIRLVVSLVICFSFPLFTAACGSTTPTTPTSTGPASHSETSPNLVDLKVSEPVEQSAGGETLAFSQFAQEKNYRYAAMEWVATPGARATKLYAYGVNGESRALEGGVTSGVFIGGVEVRPPFKSVLIPVGFRILYIEAVLPSGAKLRWYIEYPAGF